MAVVGNKSDIIQNEVVDEEKVRDWAKEIGAIFISTSAKQNKGINELFNKVGLKLIAPNIEYKDSMKITYKDASEGIKTVNTNVQKRKSVKIKTDVGSKKKGCCKK